MADKGSGGDNRRNSADTEMGSRRTRFQVNRVDTLSAGEGDELNEVCVSENKIEDEDFSGDSMRKTSVADDIRADGTTGSPTALMSQNSEMSSGYDTKYAKSFRHFTREALPRLDNYRNIMSIQAAYRPTLDELHNATLHEKQPVPGVTTESGKESEGTIKFGWIKGVLVRCLLNIWGVMLFLRLSWVVGQAGIGECCLVVIVASVVTIISAVSMSAICTNGQIKGGEGMLIIVATCVVTSISALSMSAISTNGVIKGGGTYYMISRSLGPEFGASIGLIFSLANAVAVAMYTVGFAESMRDLLKSLDTQIVDGGLNDVRIVGSIAIVLLTGIVVIGMEWEAKAQVGLLFILILAMLDFVIGSFIGPMDDDEKAKGFVGYGGDVLSVNLNSDYRISEGKQQDFFSVFSIFFPAATGILAGANISGDLADPQSAIPKGTLLAILVTTISYLGFTVIAGATVLREASGNMTEVLTGDFTNCSTRACEWGLLHSFQVMELVSAWGPLIYAGCFAATLSSALASLVSAPKVFQALCKDKLYPYLDWFAKGYGKNNEPVRGYVLTFFIALAFILIGELNAIAPLISNFFLAAYALVNFSTFHASLAKPVGWRPTFKYYNMWLSLVGSGLCVAVMFLISWWTALLTFAVVLALYLVVIYRKPDVNWGSTTQAQTYKSALVSVQQLNNVEDHVKNYRPQILVLTGLPSSRPPLIDFAYLMSKNLSLMICGHILQGPIPQRIRNALQIKARNWLHNHKIKAFYTLVDETNFEDGSRALLQASGIGKLKPNILLLGYKGDWRQCNRSDLLMYFNVMHKALDMYLAVAILRVQEGLDYSKVIAEDEEVFTTANGTGDKGLLKPRRNSHESLQHNPSFSQLSQVSSVSDLSPPATPMMNRSRIEEAGAGEDDVEPEKEKTKKSKSGKESTADLYRGPGGSELPKEVVNNLTQFQKKQKKGTIDVWWLYDDGGLTLLLPYIISTRRNWAGCKLRVFALANKKDELDTEQRSMASLLSKFRIDYSDLQIIPDITKKPRATTKAFFDSLIEDFKHIDVIEEEKESDSESVLVTEAELLAMKDKTNRHLRLREILLEHSKDSTLVVMTLPMPRKGAVSAALYMAWLETLTKDMPPFMLVRGNQTSVLTFYS